MNIYEIPFYSDMSKLLLLLHGLFVYAEKEKEENEKKSTQMFYLKRIEQLKGEIALKAFTFMKKNKKELKSNPLLKGMLDLCLELNDHLIFGQDYIKRLLNVYRKAYDKFQILQQKYPFEGNEKMYLDSGCRLSVTSKMAQKELVWDSDKVANYPDADFQLACFAIFTETIKKQGGKIDSDYRCGQIDIPITKDQLTRIHDACPEKFEGVFEQLYQSIVASPSEFLQ